MNIGNKTTPEVTPQTSPPPDTGTEINSTGSNGQQQIRAWNPIQFIYRLWRRFSGGTALNKRVVTHLPAPGQPGYQTFKPLGRGTTGSVNLSYEPSGHQPGTALLATKSYLTRLDSADRDTEYHLLSTLDHPNIVKLKDSRIDHEPPEGGEPRTRITLYTESGVTSLHQALQQKPGLKASARDVAHIMGGLSGGMNYLHDRQITHNDLKPGNLVIMPDTTVKLIDFGSAVDFRPDSPLDDMNGSGTPNHGAIGSPGYRSPEIEVLDDRRGFDFESLKKGDYWAVGATLYELVTAAPLCHPRENPETIQAEDKINEIPDDTGDSIEGWTNEDVAALKTALRGLLDPDPAQRSLTGLNTFIARFFSS